MADRLQPKVKTVEVPFVRKVIVEKIVPKEVVEKIIEMPEKILVVDETWKNVAMFNIIKTKRHPNEYSITCTDGAKGEFHHAKAWTEDGSFIVRFSHENFNEGRWQ